MTARHIRVGEHPVVIGQTPDRAAEGFEDLATGGAHRLGLRAGHF